MVNPLLTAGDVRDVVPGELLKHCVLGLSLRDELWESVEEAAQVPCLGCQLVGRVNHTNMLQHWIVQRQFFSEGGRTPPENSSSLPCGSLRYSCITGCALQDP